MASSSIDSRRPPREFANDLSGHVHRQDDPWLDVEGAQAAGFRSAWINRTQARWPAELKQADITVTDLSQLADLIDEVPA